MPFDTWIKTVYLSCNIQNEILEMKTFICTQTISYNTCAVTDRSNKAAYSNLAICCIFQVCLGSPDQSEDKVYSHSSVHVEILKTINLSI